MEMVGPPSEEIQMAARFLLGGDDQRGGDEASQWLQIFRGPTETLLNPLKGIRVMLLAPVQ